MDIKCENCFYYDKSQSECRFNPPTLVVENGSISTLWPYVALMGWCGKFKDKEIVK